MAIKKVDETITPGAEVPAAVKETPAAGANVPANLGDIPPDPSQYPPDNELPLPRVTLLQPTAEAVTIGGHKAGSFLNAVTDEEADKIVGVVLAMGMSRTRWGAGDKQKEVICKAVDHDKGVGNPGGACAACTLKDWGADDLPDDQRKPKCAESYDFVVIDEHGLPFIFSNKGKALKPAKRFIAGAKGRGLPLFCFHVEITSQRVTNEKGTFFIPTFAFKGQTDSSTWRELAVLATQCLAASRRQPPEQTTNGADAEAAEY